MVIRLLNTCEAPDRADRRRRWLGVGEPLMIGPGCVLKLMEHAQTEGDRETVLVLEKRGQSPQVFPLPVGASLDATPLAKVLIVPRAAAVLETGQTSHVFLEFCRLQKHEPLAV